MAVDPMGEDLWALGPHLGERRRHRESERRVDDHEGSLGLDVMAGGQEVGRSRRGRQTGGAARAAGPWAAASPGSWVGGGQASG